jgi:hypothetical protein
MRLYLEKPITKKGGWSGSRGRPLVQTPVLQKQNKNLERKHSREIRSHDSVG